jgi:hypothetical protein
VCWPQAPQKERREGGGMKEGKGGKEGRKEGENRERFQIRT